MDLYQKIGESKVWNLLADPNGCDKIAVNLMPGNGKVQPGTVLFRESNGMYSPAATGDVATTNMLVVLGEEVDTDSGITEVGEAYRAGRFLDGVVKLGNGDALTAAHKIVLRKQGIEMAANDGMAAYDNSIYTVTYKANNGATPAEDDVVKAVAAGDTHTVLSNSDTAFTAPSTKSFSKWNTKDDGSGTDYSAAASLTVTGNVTLYAVWA